MKRATLALLAMAVVLATGWLLPGAASAHDEDPIEAALAKPHATGLLVMSVVPQSQCSAAGIVEGDVLLSYDGAPMTDVPSLTAAKEAAASKESVTAVVLRAADGERIEITLQPGSLGLHLVPIVEGESPAPLPADTGAVLDAAKAGVRDEWASLALGGEKCGMEHILVRAEGDLLHVTHEVAFDGGEQWGMHHSITRAVMRCGATAEPVSLTYENGLNGWISRSQVVRSADGRPVWRAEAGLPGEEPTVTEIALRGDQSSVPSYALAQLARLLPQEAGTCLRFRPVADWDGKPGRSAALVCVGEETVTIGETEHATWKYQVRQLGGTASGTYWFDAQRRLVQADYGGAVATTSTKEQALDGLHEDLKLHTEE